MNNTISAPSVLLLAGLLFSAVADAQPYPNPYRAVEGWASLPDSRTMGAVGDIDVDPDGTHMWAVIRCDATAPDRFGNECVDSSLDPILKFDSEGNVVESFGGDMFIWPHGIDVDSQGNVWVTDAVSSARIPDGDKRGHQVVKFSPSGQVLMTLGTPGEEGGGQTHFTSPADVVIGDDGAIFVADGHGNNGNNRVVKFDRNGRYISAWGETGYGPGEFRVLHTIAIDQRGRLFVGDRSNNRIQLFDQEGNFISQWTQFGRPSGIFFDQHDNIYVADSESDDVQNPGWEMGIRIGDAELGWVHYFIQLPTGDPRSTAGDGAEFVAADSAGNLYGGEPSPRKLQKYIRVRP
ncbi:MAG: peptidyl-alpha-hydroxyglycine alpha-amidating lyase family protein [Pseudohongiellaceae bacterium]